jgi:aarF domain-containing kinase
MSVLKVAQLLPKGMYIENVIKCMKVELMDECDYYREADCTRRFKEILKDDNVFSVPAVYDHLSTKSILTSDIVYGKPFDKHEDLSQEQRNFVSSLFIDVLFG